MNSEWNLTAAAARQLYTICITSISDYAVQVWWKGQRSYIDKLQKLQNSALRKILRVFKISFIAALQIEAAVSSSEVRLNRLCRQYALKVTTLSENHSIRKRTSYSFSSKYQTEIDVDDTQYLNWFQSKNNL